MFERLKAFFRKDDEVSEPLTVFGKARSAPPTEIEIDLTIGRQSNATPKRRKGYRSTNLNDNSTRRR